MDTITSTKNKDMVVNWKKLDANGVVLGRIATQITELLIGKHKVNYVPYLNSGDKIVVVNANKVVVTGNKETDKVYHSHSQYVGNLKSYTVEQVRAKDASQLIYKAVKGMLPKNRLRDVRLANLYIYNDENHPHHGQLKDK